jgi:hypothetical protein
VWVCAGVVLEDDSLLVEGDVLDLVDGDEQELVSQPPHFDFEQVGSIDARAETDSAHDPDLAER